MDRARGGSTLPSRYLHDKIAIAVDEIAVYARVLVVHGEKQ